LKPHWKLLDKLKHPSFPHDSSAVFACRTAQDAASFRDQFRGGGLIFEIETTGGMGVADIYFGDYELLTREADATSSVPSKTRVRAGLSTVSNRCDNG
jgi:hypothetical protein